MEFSNELKEMFLNGGQVVYINRYKCLTILVRMPKDNFIQDDRKDHEDNSFEYAYAQNINGGVLVEVVGYRNGGLRVVKALIAKEHTELSRTIKSWE